jgi:hypothetical protein
MSQLAAHLREVPGLVKAQAKVACDGQDDDGYRYTGSAHCHVWLDHWLPKR